MVGVFCAPSLRHARLQLYTFSEGKEHNGDAPYKPFTFMVEGISKCFGVLGLQMWSSGLESRC